jgi:hypothetical protein
MIRMRHGAGGTKLCGPVHFDDPSAERLYGVPLTAVGWASNHLTGWKKPRQRAGVPYHPVTVAGVTHRLIWLDRRPGYRIRCSCGWADSKVRWTGRRATLIGKGHIRSARAAARRRAQSKPLVPRRRSLDRRRADPSGRGARLLWPPRSSG